MVAGVCASLASTSAPVAVAVVVACVVAAGVAVRDRRDWRSLWAPVLAPLGIVGFFGYLWAHTGTPFEWFRAQRAGWQGGTTSGGSRGRCDMITLFFSVPNYAVKACPPSSWSSCWSSSPGPGPRPRGSATSRALIVLGTVSPVIAMTPRLLLRAFPLLGVVGANCHPSGSPPCSDFRALHGRARDDGHGRTAVDTLTPGDAGSVRET